MKRQESSSKENMGILFSFLSNAFCIFTFMSNHLFSLFTFYFDSKYFILFLISQKSILTNFCCFKMCSI